MQMGSAQRIGARWFATLGILVVVGACSATTDGAAISVAPSGPVAATQAVPSATAGPSATATATAGSSASTAASLAPGRVVGHVIGGSGNPTYSVEALEGWSTEDGGFIVSEAGSALGISVWDVGQVPSDPCHPIKTLADPGPSVDDLVDALVAQKTRNATKPVDVTIAGHPATFLQWSVPADMVMTGDADFVGCDVQDNGHLDFVSWRGDGQGSRYQQMPGQVDRLWVLEVDGHRLLIDATYTLDVPEADRDELQRLVESIEFTVSR